MTRRSCMLLAIALGACGRVEPMPDLFPETAAGQWHRTSLRDLPAGESPDPVSRTSIDRIQTATYQGPGRVEARVYRLSSPAVGLDVVQRWHPSADTVFFNQGRYFVVVKWQEAERQALQAFVRELETRLAPPRFPGAPSGFLSLRARLFPGLVWLPALLALAANCPNSSAKQQDSRSPTSESVTI